MTMIRCSSGHYFDDEQYSSCPVCGVDGLEVEETETVPATNDNTKEESTVSFDNQDKSSGPSSADPDDEVTVAMVKKEIGLDPVCGWLVCTEGTDKGRDYRIKSERNFIGRSPKMDIAISGDDSISRENHASITYDPKNNRFSISAGDSRGLIYKNGESIESNSSLEAFDEIDIGSSKFKFIPFVGENFSWKK